MPETDPCKDNIHDAPPKKAEFPFWMPPHYRALSRSSQRFAARHQEDPDTLTSRNQEDGVMTTHGTFLSAMAILICADLILWLGIRKWFPKGSFMPPWRYRKTNQSHHTHTQDPFHTTSPPGGGPYKHFNSEHTPFSQTFTRHVPFPPSPLPPVVTHHMRVLGLGHITDRLPTRTEVKHAYRQVSLSTHPDTFRADMSETDKKTCQQRFIAATSSYEALLGMTSPLHDTVNGQTTRT